MAASEDIGGRVRTLRRSAGLTQEQLAERADVSRALVGALERGRHVPAADAAVRLARALGATVEQLVAPSEPGAAARTVQGRRPPEGALVRASRVGERPVVRVVGADAAISGVPVDGAIVEGRARCFAGAATRGAIVAGCDPLLTVAESLLERPDDARVVGAPATTGQATAALAGGRCHGAVVHGPAGALLPPDGVRRWHVARWRSGLGIASGRAAPSVEALLGGDVPLIGRDPSAASQQAVERAAERLGVPAPRPAERADGHLDAAHRARGAGAAAVTIEPVATALGLRFRPLEVHDVELWVPDRWLAHPGVRALVDLLRSRRLLDRARTLPAYDLAATGDAR